MPDEAPPKWRQVADWLSEGIRSGRWPIDSRIPTPPTCVTLLADETGLHVDRNTIRTAITALARAGVLEPRTGSGTYVVSLPGESLPSVRRMSPIERRLNERIDALEARLRALEKERGQH